MPSLPRGPISSTATARFWRPTCACRRSMPSRAASSTSTRRWSSSRQTCPISTPPSCANDCRRGAALSGSSATSPRNSSARFIIRACRASASSTRTSAIIPTPPKSRICSAASTSTIKVPPASRNGSTTRGSPRCTWRGSRPTGCKRRCSSPSTCGCSTRCVTSWSRRATNSTPLRQPVSCSTSAPAKLSPWCRSRTTTRTFRTIRAIRASSTD